MNILTFLIICTSLVVFSHVANIIEHKFGTQEQYYPEHSVIEIGNLNIHFNEFGRKNQYEFTLFQFSIDGKYMILCFCNIAVTLNNKWK